MKKFVFMVSVVVFLLFYGCVEGQNDGGGRIVKPEHENLSMLSGYQVTSNGLSVAENCDHLSSYLAEKYATEISEGLVFEKDKGMKGKRSHFPGVIRNESRSFPKGTILLVVQGNRVR